MAGINYPFPPDQIDNLPSWRFVFHFPVESVEDFDAADIGTQLEAIEFEVIEFPRGFEPKFVHGRSKLKCAVEVTEKARRRRGALGRY